MRRRAVARYQAAHICVCHRIGRTERSTSRAYSLIDSPNSSDCYRIAVLRIDDGQGRIFCIAGGMAIGNRINY